MEANILAGGKAERLGDAAAGRPKALVDVAGRPLAAYQVGQLARAGVGRVIVSCAAGKEDEFAEALAAAMRRPLLLDGRNFLDPEEARQAGFLYEGMGRGAAEVLPQGVLDVD